MVSLTFAGQSARDQDNEQGNSGRLINCYREPLPPGGKSTHAIKSVLGMTEFVTLPDLHVRDMTFLGSSFYVLVSDTLYSIGQAGTATALGTTVSAEGAQIFGNKTLANQNVCVVSDGRYFVWDGSTMSEPTSGAFSAFGSGDFLSGYVLLTEEDGQRLQWSDLADPTSLPGLNFATMEGRDDNNLRVMAIGGRAWIMKERSIEVWYPTGQAGANAFARMTGAVYDIGLKSKRLAAKFNGGAFFVGSDGIVYLTDGATRQPISSSAVETAIRYSDPTTCFSYTDEGHKFCVIKFSDRPAWCYDIATGEWHERANGFGNDLWNAEASAKAWGDWYVGSITGKIDKLSRTNEDNGAAMVRRIVSSTLYNEGKRFRIPKLEFTGRVGRFDQSSFTTYVDTIMDREDGTPIPYEYDALVLEDADYWEINGEYTREPQIMVRLSKDNGQTWGPERTRDIGRQGEYRQRIVLRSLGQFRQATAEVTTSDPIDFTMDANANLEIV